MKNQKKTAGCGTFILTWVIVAVFLGVFFNAINKTGQSVGSIVLISVVFGFFLSLFIWLFWNIIKTKKNMRNQNQINSGSGNGTTVPKPPIVPSAKVVNQEVSQKTIDDRRMAFIGQQAVNEIRIIDESLRIMETTSDIDTFLSRYETAMRCILTLEQAKKAGQQIALPDGYSQSLVSAKNKALTGVLYRSFNKELDEINKLKTERGKLNRINRYQEKLREMHETEIQFVADQAYNDIMQKLEYIKNG